MCTLTLSIQQSILASFLSSLRKSSVVIAHISLPCSIAVRTQASCNLPFTLRERPLVTNNGRRSLNFAQSLLILATTLV
uniref:Uncharacterized protein n=1 Tax=Octopus bimaculoides TaxID=37653 RepID=A0A0L8GY10_OCTBM